MTNEIRALIKQRGKINKKAKRRTRITFVLLEMMYFLKLESVKLSILTGLPKRYLILNVLITKIGGN